MLAAVGDEAQKAAAAMRILAIFIQMDRKFLDSAGQNGHLHLRRARIGVVTACFANLVLLLALRKHCRTVSRSLHLCKPGSVISAIFSAPAEAIQVDNADEISSLRIVFSAFAFGEPKFY